MVNKTNFFKTILKQIIDILSITKLSSTTTTNITALRLGILSIYLSLVT